MKDLKEIKKFVKETIEFYLSGDNSAIVSWLDLENGLSLVFGYSGGFENSNEPLCNGEYRLCSKIAYNCDGLQCDYEWDWNMPFNKESGEVWDTDHEYKLNTKVNEFSKWVIRESTEIAQRIEMGELVGE